MARDLRCGWETSSQSCRWSSDEQSCRESIVRVGSNVLGFILKAAKLATRT